MRALLAADLRLAPTMLRLAFHAAGTYDSTTGLGGNQCAILNGTSPANLGLAAVISQLKAVQQHHAGASLGDVYTLASVVAVAAMEGPVIPWRSGRVDAACTPPDAEALLPDAMTDGFGGAATADGAPARGSDFAPARMRAKFARMGLSDEDTVALIGAHTVGFGHFGESGFFGAWTLHPLLFTNEFFVNFAASPPNALDAAGAAQFLGAWRANALVAAAGRVTQFRDGPFRALTGAETELVPSAPVTSTAYAQPLTVTAGPGNQQGGPARNEYMRLPTDMALVADASYRALVRRFSAGSPRVGSAAAPTAGSADFFATFAASMQKMHELGVPASQLTDVVDMGADAPPAAATAASRARARMPASHAALLAGAGAALAAGCPFA